MTFTWYNMSFVLLLLLLYSSMLVCLCKTLFFFWHGLLRLPRVFSFFLLFWLRGKRGGRWYITMHVWIPAEPGGGDVGV